MAAQVVGLNDLSDPSFRQQSILCLCSVRAVHEHCHHVASSLRYLLLDIPIMSWTLAFLTTLFIAL